MLSFKIFLVNILGASLDNAQNIMFGEIFMKQCNYVVVIQLIKESLSVDYTLDK